MNEQNWAIQFRKGTLELCVLAIVGQEASYGYDIVQKLAAHGHLAISEGTVYPLLSRLLREGEIEAHWHDSPSGPPRKYYGLTAQGRETLRAMRQEWEQIARSMNDLLGGSGV